jgi:hypothetical protein
MSSNNYFIYKVIWFDDDNYEEITHYGTTFGHSYAEAMSNVIADYGENESISIELKKLADENTLRLDQDTCNKIYNDDYND